MQENTQELAVVPLLGYSIGYNVVQTILDSSKFEDILRTGLYFNYFPGGILRYYLHIGALVGALMMWTDPSGKTWRMDPLLEALTALGQ